MVYEGNEAKIMGWVHDLSKSQGVYGRLYRDLENDDEYRKKFCDRFAACNDMLDFIMEYEG